MSKLEDFLLDNYSYDSETGMIINKKRPGKPLNGKNRAGYLYLAFHWEGKIKSIYHHRFAFLFMNNRWPYIADHINGIKNDNRWINLREVNDQQNGMNRGSNITSTSKFKGVCWDKANNKWMAKIKINKKMIYLGRFNSEEEAAKVYDEKAIELFGEYVWLNFKKD